MLTTRVRGNNHRLVRQEAELDDLVEKYGGKYDCEPTVPFSGGKDSTWTLYCSLKSKYKQFLFWGLIKSLGWEMVPLSNLDTEF